MRAVEKRYALTPAALKLREAIMHTLDLIRDQMTALGWEDGGQPGSAKRDADGNVIAHAGSDEWMADVELAGEHVERAAIIAEIERRDREWQA